MIFRKKMKKKFFENFKKNFFSTSTFGNFSKFYGNLDIVLKSLTGYIYKLICINYIKESLDILIYLNNC